MATLAGAEYLVRPGNSHAKGGNLNAALPRTEGELSSSSTPTRCRC